MSRWGKCDFSQLKELEHRLTQLEQADLEGFCQAAAQDLAARLLAKVIKRTPVGQPPQLEGPRTIKIRGQDQLVQTKNKKGELVFRSRKGKTYTLLTRTGEIYSRYWAGYQGGALRQGWTVLPIEKKGGAYQITVTNNLLYASYVEYGHRQTPGRYVPALGKRLKAAWVPGRYMMTISVQELEHQAPALLEKRLNQFLRGCFDAG